MAFVVSVFLFGVQGALLQQDGADDGGLAWVLVGVGVWVAMTQPFVGRALAPFVDLQLWYILRFAMAEFSVSLGVVAVMVGGSVVHLGLLCFLALASLAMMMPGESGVQQYLRFRGEER